MTRARLRFLKVTVFLLCLVPLGNLLLGTFGLWGFSLGPNPVEALIHGLGNWGLNFLLMTLAVTPLRQLSGQPWLLRLRRMLGLFAFFYVLLHFLVYAGLDQRFDLPVIFEDIAERPYITLGFAAFVLLIPLAATSTRGMVRRLGGRWKKLHRLVYPIAILAVWHYYWLVKADVLQPLLYAATLALLLGYRVRTARARRAAKR
ncbi:MAG: protein-methionine-sulfoxide reductase heme-binding subunit MsrQ [Xanthomonadales bacterium]|jgi:sulfoxide reductase heme-binding subunit YedZ|nr:protein-methionine-sulfoxide reductase heme-binding subunit MsrQ [Xanthomonadales bacterium]